MQTSRAHLVARTQKRHCKCTNPTSGCETIYISCVFVSKRCHSAVGAFETNILHGDQSIGGFTALALRDCCGSVQALIAMGTSIFNHAHHQAGSWLSGDSASSCDTGVSVLPGMLTFRDELLCLYVIGVETKLLLAFTVSCIARWQYFGFFRVPACLQ